MLILIVAVLALVILIISGMIERLSNEYQIYRILQRGESIEATVVGNKRIVYGPTLKQGEICYQPIVIYCIGSMQVRATALNNMPHKFKVGARYTVKVWDTKPDKAVILHGYEGDNKTELIGNFVLLVLFVAYVAYGLISLLFTS